VGNPWVAPLYHLRIMSEYLTSDSFIVRIYRTDTEDSRKITGLVEMLDGSGERASFTDTDELDAIVNQRINKLIRRRMRKSVKLA
jgi:hypothetical protein